MSKGLFAYARENFEGDITAEPEVPVVTDGEADAIIDSSDDLGTAEADAVDLEIDDAQNTIAQGEVIESATADIAEKLNEAADEGGLSPAGAGAVSAALEALRLVAGGRPEERKEMSFESFGPRDSRVEATRKLALEADGFLASVGKGIMSVINRILQLMGDFFRAAINDSERYRQKAIQLAKVAKSMGNVDTPTEQHIEDAHLARVLSLNGQTPDQGAFAQAYSKFSHGNTSLDLSKQLAIAQKLTILTEKLVVADANGAAGHADEVMTHIADTLQEAVGSNPYASQKFVFGGFEIRMQADKDKLDVKMKVTPPENVSALPVLSASVCADVAQAAADHFKGWIDSARGFSKFEATLKSLTRQVTMAQKITKVVGQDEASGKLSHSRAMLENLQSFTLVAIKEVRKYELATSKAAVQYVAKSLAQLRGAAKGAPQAAA